MDDPDQLAQYDYPLPRELIAQSPAPQRVDARLMVLDRLRRTIRHAHVRDLPALVRAGDCLVLNDTRVVPARLEGYRERTGGRWSGLFVTTAEGGLWRVLCKTRGTLRAGETIVLRDRRSFDALRLRLLSPLGRGEWAARPESDQSAWDLLEQVGRTPLPPYIRGGRMVEADREAYQTVFARQPGAVAAPTAGLHFTWELLEQLEQAGVAVCRVTLHVGPGTFRPIKSERLSQHRMHAEWGRVSEAAVRRIAERRAAGGRVIAVGTTVVRLLETAAAGGRLEPWRGETDLFIRPPYRFRAVDALMTNFHLPKSTLLVLAAAFAGREFLLRAYREAVAERYRFYSYGDAMLIC